MTVKDDLPGATLTRREAAESLGRSVRTVDEWIRSGRLAAFRNELTREVRIPEAAVQAELLRAGVWVPVQVPAVSKEDAA